MQNILILLKHFGALIAKNPVNTLFAIGFFVFAIRTYVFDGGFTDRMLMCGCLVLWAVWFLLTHMFFLLIVSVIVGGAAYMYYANTQRLKAECEQSGGVWNGKTRKCEEKVALTDQIKNAVKEWLLPLSGSLKSAASKQSDQDQDNTQSQKDSKK